MTEKTNGLDMEKTIEWYSTSGVQLPRIKETDLQYQIENEGLIELSRGELGGLVALFPENARKRSVLRKIVGQPYHWFHKNPSNENERETTNPEEAISPTAIIPSYIDTKDWRKTNPVSDIWLYQLPRSISPEIRRIVLAEGFVHEYGHSLTSSPIYIEGYKLKLQNGETIDAFNAIIKFTNMAEKHPSISHYASTYRGKNNKFESDDPKYDAIQAINEEFAETVAAHLLGFAYCGDDKRSLDPFKDRPEIKEFIIEFLNAEEVKKE